MRVIRWSSLVLVLVLTGCGSTKVVREYEGDPLPDRDVATVQVPYEVDLQFVDGKKIPLPTRLASGDLEIKLLPGPHELEARYYMPSTAGNANDRSDPYVMRFAAEAGKTYRIGFGQEGHAPNREWALWLTDAKTGTYIDDLPESAMPWAAQPVASQVAVAATPLSSAPSVNPAPSASAVPGDVRDITALDQLRYWWSQADATQREAFLKWLVTR